MSSKQVNVAMIGLGFGAEFIPIYQAHPNAHVYAICQRNKEHLNLIGDRFQIEHRFTDYAEVLKDPKVDFVHINSPIPDHAAMSMQALNSSDVQKRMLDLLLTSGRLYEDLRTMNP